MSKLRWYTDINTLRTVYFALVNSKLQSGIISYGSANETTLKPLKVAQNNTIRMMTFSDRRSKLKPLYKNLNILKLEDMHKLELIKHMCKCKYNKLPSSLQKSYEKAENVHNHSTRQASNLGYFVPKINTSFGKKSSLYSGVVLWNNSPKSIKENSSIRCIKKQYCKLLLSDY